METTASVHRGSTRGVGAGHIVGQNGAGALESVSRIELKLHPHQYARPGTYRGEIRNLRYEIAE